VTKLFRLIRT